MTVRRSKYSDAEIDWLGANFTLPLGEYHRRFVECFGRHDITKANLNNLRKSRGWRTGRTGRFEKGHVPTGEGVRGFRTPRAIAAQFNPGQRPHNYHGPGNEWTDRDGNVWLIVTERNPWTGSQTRHVRKQKWLWEQKYGPVPDGYVLKCLDGNRSNTDPQNWQSVPRGLISRLNSRHYDGSVAELKPVIMATAKLEHAVKSRARDSQNTGDRYAD